MNKNKNLCEKKKKKRKKTHYNARLSVIASNKLAFMPISSNQPLFNIFLTILRQVN